MKIEKLVYFLGLLFVFTIAISKTANLVVFLLWGISWCVVLIKNSEKRRELKNVLKDPVLLAFLLYLGMSIIGIFYSENPVEGFRRTKVLLNFPFIYTFFQLDKSERKWHYLVAFIAGIFTFDTMGFLLQILKYKTLILPFRPLGVQQIWTGNINAFALYGLLFIILKKDLSIQKKFFSFLVLAGILGAIVLTGSRTAYLGMISTLFIFFVIESLKRKKYNLLVSGLGILFIFSLAFYQIPFVKHRSFQIYSNIKAYTQGKVDTSIGLRFEMWKASYYIIKKHLLFGSGTGDYQVDVKKLIKKGIVSPAIAKFNHPHNTYLFVMDTLGIVGLFILLVFFYLISLRSLKCYINYSNTLCFYLFLCTIHLLIGSLTENLFYIHIIFVAYACICGICLSSFKRG